MQPEGRTILLVADDPQDMGIVRRALHKSSVLNPVRSVKDTHEAVRYLSGEGPDGSPAHAPTPMLILLNLEPPWEAGFSFLQWVKARPPLNRVPVIVLSSSSDPADIHRAYDLGANSYLVKPKHFEELVSMMRALGLYWLAFNENSGTADRA